MEAKKTPLLRFKNYLFGRYSAAVMSSIILTVIPLIVSSVVTFLVIQNEAKIEHFGFVEWLLATIFCCFTSIFLTAPTVLAVIFGYFLAWNAIIPLFVLNMGAIYLVNSIAKKIDQEKTLALLSQNEKVKTVLAKLHNDELRFIFFIKLSPIMPFSLTNLTFSLSNAKLKNILLGGFLGMIPRTLLAIWTGMQGREIRELLEHPNQNTTTQVLLILLTLASLMGFFWLIKINPSKKS